MEMQIVPLDLLRFRFLKDTRFLRTKDEVSKHALNDWTIDEISILHNKKRTWLLDLIRKELPLF